MTTTFCSSCGLDVDLCKCKPFETKASSPKGKTLCEWCGFYQPDDEGSYYHKKECEGKFLRLVDKYFRVHMYASGIKLLKHRTEMAEFVGD
jgi:hypothetical protein